MFFSSILGKGEVGMTEGSFASFISPNQSGTKYFPFCLFFIRFYYIFFYVVRKTVVSMKLSLNLTKMAGCCRCQSGITKRKCSYCEYHFRIVMFTIVCKLCFIPTVTMYCMESVWSQVADLLCTDTFKKKLSVTCRQKSAFITSDYTSCVRILSIDWSFYCSDYNVPLTTVETLRTAGLWDGHMCLGFTCHFS